MKMTDLTFSIPWDKYGLMTEVIKRLKDGSPQVGKTVIMKFVYLLQEVFKVPTGYDFTLYTYGPYNSEVLSDLDYLEHLKAIKIDEGALGYYIIPGEKAEIITDRAKVFLSKNEKALNNAITMFGKMKAKELELRSTIVYLINQKEKQNTPYNFENIKNEFLEIKPNFTPKEVLEAYKELDKFGIISTTKN